MKVDNIMKLLFLRFMKVEIIFGNISYKFLEKSEIH